MEGFLKELNKAQYEAVVNTDGPALVIAGAGSGKTRVLTYRVAYLLSRGVGPGNIICLTFTNKAAREMKERIARLVGEEQAKYVWMGTFHSIFARILRIESDLLGYSSSYTIYDTIDSKSLLKTIISEMKLNDQLYKPGDILGRISWAKNNLITPQAYATNPQITSVDNFARRSQLGEIYKSYCIRCKRSGAMDFDDLLLNTNILFRDFPETLRKYQEKFHYLLVDEYQDTNYSQYLIVNKLAELNKNICVVGDDAQSIYSFRGARIENILSFKSDYPGLHTFKLEQNYRSTKKIVAAANSLIAKNNGQIKKTVWSDNEAGSNIKVIRNLTDLEEGFFISNSIFDKVLSEQKPYSDFAVLYRTNAQSRIFEEALRKRNIPYRVYGGISFYQRKEIKDMLAYLRLSVNHDDDEALKRIINYPARGIGSVTLNKLETYALFKDISIWKTLENLDRISIDLNQGTLSKLHNFLALIRGFSSMKDESNAFEAAQQIATASGILKDLYQGNTPDEISRYENLEELMNGIKEFVDSAVRENKPANLVDYLENISLLTDLDIEKPDDRNRVTIMTMHSAKGLEFNTVYIAGVEEDLFPNRLSIESSEELEEERRLFYVAVTRAIETVCITYCQSRYRWGTPVPCRPSRFIRDIDPEYLDLPPDNSMGGFTVNHVNSKRICDSDDDPEILKYRSGNIYRSSAIARGSSDNVYRNSGKRSARPEYMQVRSGYTKVPVHKSSAMKDRHKDLISGNENFVPDNPDLIHDGMQVEHNLFGTGRVISIEGSAPNRKAKVYFTDIGEEKLLLLKFARLRIVE
ncbi:MAG: UvrD-helicase domain-containing protein [Bacteroidales bacterium]|nr:UvrD-helicase domain-containing protein [Bacteroidales bacterium]